MLDMAVLQYPDAKLILDLYVRFKHCKILARGEEEHTKLFQAVVDELAEMYDIPSPYVERDYNYCRKYNYDALFDAETYAIIYRYLNTSFLTLVHEVVHAAQFCYCGRSVHDFIDSTEHLSYEEKPEEIQAQEIERYVSRIIK
jgi:hypothetical protein